MRLRVMRASLVLLTLAVVSGHAQLAGPPLPVHVTLSVVGGRASFQSGEDIRLQLAFTADQPGFHLNSWGRSSDSDAIAVSPDVGVFRWSALMPRQSSDVMMSTEISRQAHVERFSLNDVVRFDAAGDYTVAVRVNRFSRGNGPSYQPEFAATTNTVTLHISMMSEAEERPRVERAAQRVLSSAGKGYEEWTAAAHELSFLTGDDAAIEKLRLYQGVPGRQNGNIAAELRRGFFVSRHPRLILNELDRQIRDVTVPPSFSLVNDAAEMRWWVDAPSSPRRPSGGLLPPPLPMELGPATREPFDQFRADYVQDLIVSLPKRAGNSRSQTALAIFQHAQPPPAVVQILVQQFDDYESATRAWLVSSHWSLIRDQRLRPSLIRMLQDGPPFGQDAVLGALIDLDPLAAADAAIRIVGSPTRGLSSIDALQRLPPGSLKRAVPSLVNAIRTIAGGPLARRFWNQQKTAMLLLIGDGSELPDVKVLKKDIEAGADPETLLNLNAYLVRWGHAADSSIVRLPPTAFPSMPAAVLRTLQSRGCTVPQAWNETRPHNVIASRFMSPTVTDYAVLCSKDNESSILVFPASTDRVIELAKKPDQDFMQAVSARGAKGYSRRIDVAQPALITAQSRRGAGPALPPLDHDGIHDIFSDRASEVLYWFSGAWRRFAGASGGRGPSFGR